MTTVTAGDGEVLVSGGPSGLAVRVEAAGHVLAGDEPLSLGGTATGPSPYDFLLAGLGSCTVMTLRLYADRKGWPLLGVVVRLRHGRIHAADCADCETTGHAGKIDVIERDIELRGELDAEQRQRLLEIADRCPVHRTLTNEIKIRTRGL